MPSTPEELWRKLEADGEAEVRRKMAISAYGRDTEIVKAWLDRKERERRDAEQADTLAVARSAKNASWAAVVVATLALLVAMIALTRGH